MAITAVVFDLDGTLVDSVPDIHAAGVRMLERIGRPAIDLATATGFVGNGVPKFVERCMDATGGGNAAARAEALALFQEFYTAAPDALTAPYDGVRALLDQLKAEGARLGVCTNKPEAMTSLVLKGVGLAPLFGAVVGGDTLPVTKPDPAPLHHCLARLGVSADETLYVGDSETDAATAVNANIRFALFTRGYRKTPAEEIPAAFRFDDWVKLGPWMAKG